MYAHAPSVYNNVLMIGGLLRGRGYIGISRPSPPTTCFKFCVVLKMLMLD